MLTIKWLAPHGGEEVFQADYVSRVCPEKSDAQIVFYKHGQAEEVHYPVTRGIIYVMNENGKTVSTWQLGWAPHDGPKPAQDPKPLTKVKAGGKV